MTRRTPIDRCRGFALMLAVFMIVTLAAIGVYLVTVSTGQTQAVSQDEQGVRAYQAALHLRAAALVATVDSDNTEGRLAELRAARDEEQRKAHLPVAVGEAHPHGEAWLLDERATLESALREHSP